MEATKCQKSVVKFIAFTFLTLGDQGPTGVNKIGAPDIIMRAHAAGKEAFEIKQRQFTSNKRGGKLWVMPSSSHIITEGGEGVGVRTKRF